MRPHAAGLVGCIRCLSIPLFFQVVFAASSASADLGSITLKRPVGRGTASSTVTAPGVPILCKDVETGSSFVYQAQHLFSSGGVDHGWSPDSSEHCVGSNNGYRARPIDDDLGGEYYCWVDARTGESDVYVQHLTASGDTCTGWSRGGFVACSAPYSQYNLDATSDSQGGLLLAWQDFRSGHGASVYCLRVDPNGEIASGWSADGVAIADRSTDQLTPRVASDAAGGAFVFWLERESAGLALRAQHLTPSGGITADWPSEGIELVPGSHHVAGVSAIADSSGTITLFWRESPDSSGLVVRYGKVRNALAPDSTWANGATSLSQFGNASADPTLLRNTDGGLLVAWPELSGTTNSLKLERLSPDGSIAAGWSQTGVEVIQEGVGLSTPALLADGTGGAFIAWEDRRSGSGRIWAHHVQGDGAIASSWQDGTLVCDASAEQHAPMLAPDGNGDLIATWVDDANSASGVFVSSLLAADAMPTFLRAETNSGYARLIWNSPSALSAVVRGFRADGEGWVDLGVVAPDDSSHFVVEDKSAPPGALVRYRLSLENSEGQVFLTPVTVLIPTEPTVLELRRAWAPSRSNVVMIEFALPRGPSPRAEIFDVTGRRVGDRLLAQYAPGIYRTQIPFETRARTGVFFLRLTQGSKALTRRVVLVR